MEIIASVLSKLRFLSRHRVTLSPACAVYREMVRMSQPARCGLVDRVRRACRRAAHLASTGHPSLAEALLRRAIRWATAARNPLARRLGCERLADFCLMQHRAAEAAAWYQQAVSAWCDAGCPGAPNLTLAAAVGAANGEPTLGMVNEASSEAGRTASRGFSVGTLLGSARMRASVRDWRGALAFAAMADKCAQERERTAVRRFRQSLEVLAALDADVRKAGCSR